MSVEIADNTDRSRYEAYIDGKLAGQVNYVRDAEVIVFTHTEVRDEFEGHGVGGALASHVLNAARAEMKRVVAMCPFIAKYVERHTEYADLVVE